jgi:hypothetical protein
MHHEPVHAPFRHPFMVARVLLVKLYGILYSGCCIRLFLACVMFRVHGRMFCLGTHANFACCVPSNEYTEAFKYVLECMLVIILFAPS